MAGKTTAELLAASGGQAGFDPNLINRDKGAPIKVRAAVGAAHSAKDKLLTLRQWFPDAIAYGDDNFVFTDPETGQPTLYNEEGTSVFGLFNAPTIGDVAGAGIDIATGVGGTAGAVGGGLVGGGLPGGVVGGAAGAGLAEQGYDWLAENYLGTVDTRSAGEAATDAAITMGLGGLSEVGGALLGKGVKSAAAPVIDAFKRQGVKATPAMMANSGTVRGAEAALEKLPFAQGPVLAAQERALAQTEAAAQRTAQSAADLAGPGTAVAAPDSAGAAVMSAAKEAGDAYRATRNTMDDKVLALIGKDKKVGIQNVGALWRDLTDQLAAAPDVAASKVGDARAELSKVIREAARGIGKNLDELPPDPKDWPPELLDEVLSKGQLAYDTLRNARTQTGKLLKAPDAGGMRALGKDQLEGAYQAVRRDILKAADDTSPEAGALQRDLDSFVNAFRGGGKDSVAAQLTKLTDAASPEAAWKQLKGWAYNDATQFQRAVGKLKPAQRDELAAALIGDMGTPTKGGVGTFSPETYLSNWRAMKPGTKKLLFGDARHKELAKSLDDLEKITTGMRKGGQLKNRSNTGNVTGWLSLLGGGGGAGYLVDPVAGAGLVASGVAANLMGRAWTSPAFVKALAKFSATPWQDMPMDVARSRLARQLAAQSWAGDPAEEYVHQFMESLKAPPMQRQQPPQ